MRACILCYLDSLKTDFEVSTSRLTSGANCKFMTFFWFFNVANPLILCAPPQIFIVTERTRSDLAISATHSGVRQIPNKPTSKLFSRISCITYRYFLLGCLCGPVIKLAFGLRCRKVVSRGREDTRVCYRETMFSQMVLYEFLLHGALDGYFLYLVCAPPEKPTRRCEPEEGYLRCSKRFDHGVTV